MTVSNSKNDIDVSNHRKYAFPNFSNANIFKKPDCMKRPSNTRTYVPLQLTSPISQVSNLKLDLTQGDQSLLETLETLCRSASASSKFVDGRIKGTFSSGYVFILSQTFLSSSEIKVSRKGLGFSQKD